MYMHSVCNKEKSSTDTHTHTHARTHAYPPITHIVYIKVINTVQVAIYYGNVKEAIK